MERHVVDAGTDFRIGRRHPRRGCSCPASPLPPRSAPAVNARSCTPRRQAGPSPGVGDGLEPRARVRCDHDHRSIWSVTPPLIQPAACTFHGALRCGVQAARRARSPSVSPPRVPAPHVSPHVIGEKSKSLANLSLRVQKVAGAGRNYCKARKAMGQRGQDFCAASTARAQFPAGFALDFSLLTCSLKLIIFAFAGLRSFT